MWPLLIGKIGEAVKSAIAPTFCVQCKAAGGWLCSDCAEQIIFHTTQACHRCGIVTEGETCRRCRTKTDLDGVMVATRYEAGPIRELVHEFKYGKMTDLAGILGWMLYQGVRSKDWKGWTIVPIPLHPSRWAERGFNQAELLGGQLAKHLGVKQVGALQRTRATATQTELVRGDRLDNVCRVFKCGRDLRGLKILLVDDVMTTGATLEDAARALKDNGAREVWAAVVARGV